MPISVSLIHSKRMKDMIKICICDDKMETVEQLNAEISRELMLLGANYSISCKHNGKDLLEDMEKKEGFDVVFLDMEMDGINGIETARMIRQKNYDTSIIFISAHEQYLKEAFDLQPHNFLIKPIDDEKLSRVTKEIYEMKQEDQNQFSFEYKRTTYNLNIHDILYLCSDNRVLTMVLKDGEKTFYGQLSQIEKKLGASPCRFLRIHRSYLVNMYNIKEYNFESIKMQNEKILPISMEKRAKIRNVYKHVLNELC